MQESNLNINIGNHLKKLRDESGIDLDSIANKSKISLKVLKKLESGLLEELPSKTYVQGFVKSYCAILKVEPSESLEILDNDYQSIGSTQTNINKVNLENNKELESTKLSQKSLWSNKKLLSFLIFLIPISGLLYFIFNSSSQDKLVQTNSSKTTLPTLVESSTTTTEVKASTPPPVEEIQPVITSTTTSKIIQPTTSSTLINKINLTDEDLPFKLFKNLAKPSYYLGQRSTDFIPRKFRHRNDGFNTIYINADGGPSWIRYKVDGDDIVTRNLKNGANIYLKGSSFYITTGNFNAISVYYNNRLIESSSSQEFRRLIFPISEYSDHKRPLFINHKKKTYFYMDYEMLMNSP